MDNIEYIEPLAHGHSSLVAIVFEINFDVQTNDYISFAILQPIFDYVIDKKNANNKRNQN